MKKLVIALLFGAVLAGGFFFVTKPSGSRQPGSNGPSVADIISINYQNAAADHIRGANKKQLIDATSKPKLNVSIGDFFFDATVLKVKNGTTVTWTNDGTVGHDVKTHSDSPRQGPSSAMLEPGDKYEFTFDEPGLYLYYCSPHPTQMRGVIEVVE